MERLRLGSIVACAALAIGCGESPTGGDGGSPDDQGQSADGSGDIAAPDLTTRDAITVDSSGDGATVESGVGDGAAGDSSAPDGGGTFTIVNYRGAADPEAADWLAMQPEAGPLTVLPNVGGITTTSAPTGRFSLFVVCQNSSQVEVHLYHLTAAELPTMLISTCKTPAASFSSAFQVPLTYSGLTGGNCGRSWAGASYANCSTLNSSVWGYPGTAYDYVHLGGFENTGGISTYPPPPNQLVVERHIASATTPRTVDFASGVTTTPFTITMSGASASPEVYWLTQNGTVADVRPYTLNIGGPVPCSGVPASVRLPLDVYMIRDLEVGSVLWRFLATPADTTVPAPSRSIAAPTLTDVGTTAVRRQQASFSTVAGAVGYIFGTRNSPGFNNTPEWSSFVSQGYLQGATSYTQPDLSSAPGFQAGWNLQGSEEWIFGAVVTAHSIADLIGSAHVLSAWPGQIEQLDAFRPGSTTDGLQVEIPFQGAIT